MKGIFLVLALAVVSAVTSWHYFAIEPTNTSTRDAAAPGSRYTLAVKDYFKGRVTHHSLTHHSGLLLNIEQVGEDYSISIPSDARGQLLRFTLKASNALYEKAVTIELVTDFVGEIRDLAVAVSAACLTDEFGVFCWGGDRQNESSEVPDFLSSEAKIFGGSYYFCALENKHLVCWGQVDADIKLRNPGAFSVGLGGVCYVDNGQIHCLGNRFLHSDIFRDILPSGEGVTELAVGGNHACVIRDAKVECWGKNLFGQADPPSTLVYPTNLIAGYDYTCVLDVGRIKCWGSGKFNHFKPQLGEIKHIRANGSRLCAEDEHGWHCWSITSNQSRRYAHSHYQEYDKAVVGRNAFCVLNDGAMSCDGFEFDPPGTVSSPSNLRQSGHNTCFLDDGQIHCFGNIESRLARYETFRSNKHVERFDFNSTNGRVCAAFSSGAAACSHIAGFIKLDARPMDVTLEGAICFSLPDRIQCLQPSSASKTEPVPLVYAPTKIRTASTRKNDFTCVLDQSQVKCWGKNDAAQLDAPALNGIVDFDLNGETGCAISQQGLHCWGTPKSFVQGLNITFTDATRIDLSHASLCVVDVGRPRCWGAIEDEIIPPYLTDVSDVSTSLGKSCALDPNGVTCWGDIYVRYGIKSSP